MYGLKEMKEEIEKLKANGKTITTKELTELLEKVKEGGNNEAKRRSN